MVYKIPIRHKQLTSTSHNYHCEHSNLMSLLPEMLSEKKQPSLALILQLRKQQIKNRSS